MGKPRGKASRESHRSLDPREGMHDTTATAQEDSARACPHSRRGLTPLGRLQKYRKIHVRTGEESSGSGTDSTQGLRPRHRRERNPANSSVGKESTCNARDPGSIPVSRSSTGEGIGYPLQYSWSSLVGQAVKNLPATRETWVRFLGGEDPLQNG